jgi:acylphosphatase
METRWLLTIKGKVQGVWYRKWTEKNALELGINGFVQNEENGDVYMELEADEEILKEMLSRCWEGPERSKVEGIYRTEEEVFGYSGFEIRR